MKSEPSVFIHRKDLPIGDWIYASLPLDNGAANFTCQNCQHPHIRFVHPLKHKKSGQMIKVGCVCAEHFLEDYSNPRLRENELKNYIGRRALAESQLDALPKRQPKAKKEGLHRYREARRKRVMGGQLHERR